MRVTTEQLVQLQSKPEAQRLICILAHVDHGKTTLSDHLIGSNGLMSVAQMGELRYLDSRDDEQARGITMKSSSISLLHRRKSIQANAESSGGDSSDILVNLIDSPGHVDFCSEVSTAVRLSDGALVVIDVVEGVCIQTHAVLRQAWEEQVQLTLVLNKIDRLILEVRLTPEQAYERIKAIIVQVNMIVSAFQSEQYMSEADVILASQNVSAQSDARDSEGEDAVDEAEMDFSPEKGNVAFASAHDGWAFRINQFADLYATKMGVKADKLASIMWGDWAYDNKTKRAVKLKKGSKLKPLFVQLILGPLWKAYEAAEPGADVSAILHRITSSLKLQVDLRSLSYKEPRKALRQVLQAWLPLAGVILDMASDQLPDPVTAAKIRHKRLLPVLLDNSVPDKGLLKELDEIHKAVETCSISPEAPTMLYVSKMIAEPARSIPRLPGQAPPANQSSEVFLAFARVFSGQLRDGDTVHVLSAAYNPLTPEEHHQEVKVDGLFMMMGKGLERIEKAYAGNVIAIGGLESAILKSATLSSTKAATPIAPMLFQASAIVRVAVEPKNTNQLPQLVAGLHLLNKADPFVEYHVTPTGEHVVGAAGEVHLEMCIKDLKERFARIDLAVSPPLVAFRETCFYLAEDPDTAPKPPKVVEGHTANSRCSIRVRATALPRQLANLLDDNELLLKRCLVTLEENEKGDAHANGHGGTSTPKVSEGLSPRTGRTELDALKSKLHEATQELPSELRTLLSRAWMLGPHGFGPNVLAATGKSAGSLFEVPNSQVEDIKRTDDASNLIQGALNLDNGSLPISEANVVANCLPLGSCKAATLLGFALPQGAACNSASSEDGVECSSVQKSIESGIKAGFQLATANGELCGEPLWGVAFEVDARVQTTGGDLTANDLGEGVYGPISGQVTSVASSLFKEAVIKADPRLVEAMFLCEISTSSEGLAGTYAVLRKRRSVIQREELREGSGLFSIHAYLPAAESFGFADELRRKTSGAASASLLLSHWERLQEDPFFVPLTEEQREEYGEEGQGVGAPNFAKDLIDKVRRRKGLSVLDKFVKSSTKQRTRAMKV